MFQFLMGLNDSFDNVRGHIIMQKPLPSLNEAHSLVLQEEGRRDPGVIQVTNPTEGNNTFTVQSKRKGPKLRCDNCKKDGHTREKCFRLIGYPANFKFTNQPTYSTAQPQTARYGSTSQGQSGGNNSNQYQRSYHAGINNVNSADDMEKQFDHLKSHMSTFMSNMMKGKQGSSTTEAGNACMISGGSEAYTGADNQIDHDANEQMVNCTQLTGMITNPCSISQIHSITSFSPSHFIIDTGATDHVVCSPDRKSVV